MTEATTGVRTLEVRGPSARGEGARVLRWSLYVVLASAVVIGRSRTSSIASEPLATYQVSFTALAPDEQRIVRSMREGLLEAERMRAEKGAWPTVEQLASEGIPPFARDPLAPGLRWTLRRDGLLTGYVGESGGGPSYLLWIQEPEPGAGDPPNTPADETHHPLPGGVILHVGTWVRDGAAPASVPARPWMEGWKQVVTEVRR